MFRIKSLITVWMICLSFLTTLKAAPSEARPPAARVGIQAVTRPIADITLSFVQPGRIALIYFKEGDSVKGGHVLVQLDDTIERAQLAQIKAESENTTQIRASEASLAQRRVDLKKLEKAAARKAATELEVEHAKLSVQIAELSLELAKFEHEQAKRKYHEQSVRVENMRIKSPIDGRIEKIQVEAGESVNALADVIQVVQIDPVWIDVPVPLVRASTLEPGKTAKVEFPGPQKTSTEGTIVFVAAVADAASGTLRVRVEVPNKTRRPAGEHVVVSF